ncbi:hypothetical protein EDC94DRAFT_617527 [Helicostylum pulchrum]|nr:hypothetical protein EDC94DRAFT_617527 [Helicostylum pulchrum]
MLWFAVFLPRKKLKIALVLLPFVVVELLLLLVWLSFFLPAVSLLLLLFPVSAKDPCLVEEMEIGVVDNNTEEINNLCLRLSSLTIAAQLCEDM